MWYPYRRVLNQILTGIQTLMSSFADVQTAITTLSTDITQLSTDTIAVLNKLKAGQPIQQADIDAAVTGLQNLDASVKALDAQVNPPAPPASA